MIQGCVRQHQYERISKIHDVANFTGQTIQFLKNIARKQKRGMKRCERDSTLMLCVACLTNGLNKKKFKTGRHTRTHKWGWLSTDQICDTIMELLSLIGVIMMSGHFS